MANPQIRSFTITPSTVAPGGTAQGVVDAYDPDNRTTYVRAEIGAATMVAQLTVEDNPVPNPTFVETDSAGNPVPAGSETLNLVVDPANPFTVNITATDIQ